MDSRTLAWSQADNEGLIHRQIGTNGWSRTQRKSWEFMWSETVPMVDLDRTRKRFSVTIKYWWVP
jgi:hypothetical protein